MFLPKAFFIVAATLNAQQALDEEFLDLDTEINQLVLGDDLEETDALLFSEEDDESEPE